jgi:hypothetical protein
MLIRNRLFMERYLFQVKHVASNKAPSPVYGNLKTGKNTINCLRVSVSWQEREGMINRLINFGLS